MGYNRTLKHFTNSQELATVWSSGQNYIVNQLVLDNNMIYRCTTAHTSGATFAGDSAYWVGIDPGATITIAQGGTGQTTQTNAFDALAPTTTAGDLIVHNGTDNVRVPVGLDGQTLVVDTTQTSKVKWTSAAQGNKNYFALSNINPLFETNAVTPWSACTLSFSSGAPSGAPTLTATQMSIATSGTNPLMGLYSMRLTHAAANAQYQGFISGAFTVDREDLAKVMYGSFSYEVISGTVDFSGSSTQTLEIWVYNTVSGVWTQPVGYRGMNQSSGSGLVTFSFQTDATAANNQYKIAVITQQTSTSAYVVAFDDFKVGPSAVLVGPAVTDWQQYTLNIGAVTTAPTKGTVSVDRAYWRRVGDSMEIRYSYRQSAGGTAGSGTYLFPLPTGYSMDLNKINTETTFQSSSTVGNCWGYATSAQYNGHVVAYNSTNLALEVARVDVASTPTTLAASVGSTYGALTNTNVEIGFIAKVPIQGWSSNVQMSSDSYQGVISFTGSQTSQAITGTVTDIAFTATNDKTGSWGTNSYTVPVSGDYVMVSSWVNSAALGYARYYKNGIFTGSFGTLQPSVGQVNSGMCLVPNCKAGDTLSFRDGTTGTITQGVASVYRISGPSVLAATDTVAYRGNRTAGNYSINNSSVTFVLNSIGVDTHGSMNTSTGIYTVPVSGIYEATAKGTGFSTVANTYVALNLVMGSESASVWTAQDSTNSNYRSATVSNIKRLNAGDTIYMSMNSSAAFTLVADNAATNSLQIKRIGN